MLKKWDLGLFLLYLSSPPRFAVTTLCRVGAGRQTYAKISRASARRWQTFISHDLSWFCAGILWEITHLTAPQWCSPRAMKSSDSFLGGPPLYSLPQKAANLFLPSEGFLKTCLIFFFFPQPIFKLFSIVKRPSPANNWHYRESVGSKPSRVILSVTDTPCASLSCLPFVPHGPNDAGEVVNLRFPAEWARHRSAPLCDSPQPLLMSTPAWASPQV